MSDFSVNDPSNYNEPRYVTGGGELDDIDQDYWDSLLYDQEFDDGEYHIVRGSE